MSKEYTWAVIGKQANGILLKTITNNGTVYAMLIDGRITSLW